MVQSLTPVGGMVDSALGMQNGLTYADFADRGKTAEKLTEKTRQQRDIVSSQGHSYAVKGILIVHFVLLDAVWRQWIAPCSNIGTISPEIQLQRLVIIFATRR